MVGQKFLETEDQIFLTGRCEFRLEREISSINDLLVIHSGRRLGGWVGLQTELSRISVNSQQNT